MSYITRQMILDGYSLTKDKKFELCDEVLDRFNGCLRSHQYADYIDLDARESRNMVIIQYHDIFKMQYRENVLTDFEE